ncbi:hypothetical protein [Leucobacter komagatae]|uniref:ABC transporter n=1 Tax=Leucobacter komagatae TaxID=55969 RepID=A0A0D0IQ94_9MICO|nr:hypothetical protein [Leucobacter komagatae]KIP53764.1 hypothetical protein SD72_00755 [Leucobacter komagatae]
MKHNILLALTVGVTLPIALAACAASPAATDSPDPAATEPAGHGDIAGATEEAEPQLALLTVTTTGETALLDLLDGGERSIGAIQAPQRVATDGRYVFGDSGAGVTVTDSGAWTWDHGDHFHYYSAEPAQLGTVAGDGAATVTGGALSTAGSTGVFFAGSGEAVLLDNAALHAGSIVERFRVTRTPHTGVAAPLGDGAVVSELAAGGGSALLRVLDGSGEPSDTTAECDDPRGATTTRAGLVVLCADGAVVATADGKAATLTTVPLPAGGAHAPALLDGRTGRPLLAGAATAPDGSSGSWLFDARSLAWNWIASDSTLIRATAVGDDDQHIVALDDSGSVRVFRDGAEIAATAPLLDQADLETAALAKISLTVDASRAYLNAPALGTVFEIDFADNARIARTLVPATAPDFVAVVGR